MNSASNDQELDRQLRCKDLRLEFNQNSFEKSIGIDFADYEQLLSHEIYNSDAVQDFFEICQFEDNKLFSVELFKTFVVIKVKKQLITKQEYKQLLRWVKECQVYES